VQEIAGEDPGGLGVQNLPDGGRRHGDAELQQFALDRRWPHSGFSRARRSTSRLIPGVARGRPGLRRSLVSYFFVASLRCQARSVAGVTGEYLGPTPACHDPCQRGEPSPVRWLVPDTAGVPAQHRVLMPEHQQLGVLRLVPAEHQYKQPE